MHHLEGYEWATLGVSLTMLFLYAGLLLVWDNALVYVAFKQLMVFHLFHLQRMVALYDYNPDEQSPQKDSSSELTFKKGHIITVFGDAVSCQSQRTIAAVPRRILSRYRVSLSYGCQFCLLKTKF